jgi:hypothetical protein
VGQLVDNNACLKITITVRRGGVPEIHSATAVLAIRWCHEVGVVVSGTVLCVGNDSVAIATTTTKVVLLEVTRDFVKAITVVQIVNHVGGVEQLGHSGVDVLPGLCKSLTAFSVLGVVLEIKGKVLASIRTIVINPVVSTFPILMGEDLQTN